MLGLRASFRLSKVAFFSLLEGHARQVQRVRQKTLGTFKLDAEIEWRRHHVNVHGRTEATTATLAFENRATVSIGSEFDLRLQRPDRRSGLSFCIASEAMHFAAPNYFHIALAVLSALPIVGLSILRASTDVVTFLRTGDAATAARLRKAFGITPAADKACVLPQNLVLPTPKENSPHAAATIIVPVYNAASDLAALLERLRIVDVPIIFINDGSDDARIAPILAGFAKQNTNATVITNPKNEGFVAAVNVGLQQVKGHVILLNSDTLPPRDWVSRLLDPIVRDTSIASVTPFSNNAEIISVPHPNASSEVTGSVVDCVDKAAQRLGTQFQTVELPTGIGFCMAMNQRYLNKVDCFDPAFGRGYGEEVDWCRKTMLAGGRHVGLASLFVGHKGSGSFGDETSTRRASATAIIKRRHPSFEQDVQSWVQAAPAQAQIMALSIAWLAAISERPVPIFLGHSLGGGAETALQDDIQSRLKAGAPAVIVLRVGGPARWRLEIITARSTQRGDAAHSEIIENLLEPIACRHLIYSCGVGARHPLDAPKLLQRLINANSTLDVCLHDFFPISPSWNLLNSKGEFHGIPNLDTADPAHSVPSLDHGPAIPLREWRAEWAQLFSQANNVITFSNTSRALVTKAYAETHGKVVVRPHSLCNLPGPVLPGGATIGILGSLNRPKGAEVALRLAKLDQCKRRLVVIGEIDGQYALPNPHVVHGRYDHQKIGALTRSYDIGLWLVPSICPETFSFATHEALATGLPVLAFDRGAQGEAVKVAENGHVLQLDPSDIDAIAEQIEKVFATYCSQDHGQHRIPLVKPKVRLLR